MQALQIFPQIFKQIPKLCSNLIQGLTPNLGKIKVLSMLLLIALCLGACNSSEPKNLNTNLSKNFTPTSTNSSKVTISEVSPPPAIQKLSRSFDAYEPQVKILEPKSDQILTDTKVTVRFEVKDLPIFKNPDLGLGTHIHVILDNQEYKASYDLSQPLVFENLAVGTHTLRVFASRPWHESFKNEGAFAQSTFHVYTKTGENTPNPQLPMLTYSRPVGVYGAEPIMLDFYLQNTPLHAALLDEAPTTDWQIRVTVNGQSFNVDQWLPVYLRGFNVGLNWVKLEFLDAQGHLVSNQFNSTAHLINYQPNGTDTLSRLVRGEAIAGIEGIVNPNYKQTEVPEAKSQESKELETAPAIATPKTASQIPPVSPEVKLSEPQVEVPIPDQAPDKAPDRAVENELDPSLKKQTKNPIENQILDQPLKKIEKKSEKKLNQKTEESAPLPLEPVKEAEKAAKILIAEPKSLIQSPINPDDVIPEAIAPIFQPNINPNNNLNNNPSNLKELNPTVDTNLGLKEDATPPDVNNAVNKAVKGKVLKGLDNLNLAERLKQSRQKKAQEESSNSQPDPLSKSLLESQPDPVSESQPKSLEMIENKS
jgi:arsenate reductase-like glutaredoxin family protein